jgi:hypothetical protein
MKPDFKLKTDGPPPPWYELLANHKQVHYFYVDAPFFLLLRITAESSIVAW